MFKSVYQLLGLACRAGKVVSGDLAVKDVLARGKVKLLLVAGDAAKRTGDHFKQLALKHNIPVVECSTKLELGSALGKTPRSVAAITSKDFARGVMRVVERGDGRAYKD